MGYIQPLTQIREHISPAALHLLHSKGLIPGNLEATDVSLGVTRRALDLTKHTPKIFDCSLMIRR